MAGNEARSHHTEQPGAARLRFCLAECRRFFTRSVGFSVARLCCRDAGESMLITILALRQRSSLTEVSKQDEKVPWRSSLFYHALEEGIEQTFGEAYRGSGPHFNQRRVVAAFFGTWPMW